MQGFIPVVRKATLSLFIFLSVFLLVFASTFTLFAQTTVEELVTITAEVKGGNAHGGGGGGGGQQVLPETTVRFLGYAYPSSTVTLLKNNTVVATTVAGSSPNFELVLTGLSPGVRTFSLYSEDMRGAISRAVSVTVMVNSSAITTVSSIILPPTLDTETRTVKQGEPIILFGQSAPFAEIEIAFVNQDMRFNTIADSDGLFNYTLETAGLENGRFFVTAQTSVHNELSQLSTPIALTIQAGDSEAGPGWILKGDVNKDNRVNLVDLTIMRSWHKRSLNASMRALENERLSGDSVIDLVDFSIAAYYWTG